MALRNKVLALAILAAVGLQASITRTERGTGQAKAVTSLQFPATAFTPGAEETLIAVIATDDVSITSIKWTADSSDFTQDRAVQNIGNVKLIIARMKKASWGSGKVEIITGANSAIAGVVSSYTNLEGALNNSAVGGAASDVFTTTSFTGTPSTSLEYLWVGGIGAEGPNSDIIDTWTTADNPDNAGQKTGTTGGGAASNITVLEGYEIRNIEIAQGMLVQTYSAIRDYASALCGYRELATGGAALKDPIPTFGVVPFPR